MPFINSISGEQSRIDAALPLVEKTRTPVDRPVPERRGHPADAPTIVSPYARSCTTCAPAPAFRPRTCGSIRSFCRCPPTPCAPMVHHGHAQAVKERLPVRTTGGLSNVSFGLRTGRCSTAPSWRCARRRHRRLHRRRAQRADDSGDQGRRGASRRGQLLRQLPQGALRRHPGVAVATAARARAARPRHSRRRASRLDPLNAITDVPGVLVGALHTLVGRARLPCGSGPARTGVTAIFPHRDDIWHERVVAGAFAANGVGEIVGISAVARVGASRVAHHAHQLAERRRRVRRHRPWMMDRDRAWVSRTPACRSWVMRRSFLNDMRGMHVKRNTCGPRWTSLLPAPWPKAASGPARA